MVRTRHFHCWGLCWIPGQGTKICGGGSDGGEEGTCLRKVVSEFGLGALARNLNLPGEHHDSNLASNLEFRTYLG